MAPNEYIHVHVGHKKQQVIHVRSIFLSWENTMQGQFPCRDRICGSTIQGTSLNGYHSEPKSTENDFNVVLCFKFKELNQRGVFSGPANLSRLKTQLALEANKR